MGGEKALTLTPNWVSYGRTLPGEVSQLEHKVGVMVGWGVCGSEGDGGEGRKP